MRKTTIAFFEEEKTSILQKVTFVSRMDNTIIFCSVWKQNWQRVYFLYTTIIFQNSLKDSRFTWGYLDVSHVSETQTSVSGKTDPTKSTV